MDELLGGTKREQTNIVSSEHRFLKRQLDDEFHSVGQYLQTR